MSRSAPLAPESDEEKPKVAPKPEDKKPFRIDLEGLEIPDEIISEISDAMAQLYKVVPLRLADGTLTIATCEPQNLTMEDELRRFLGYDIRMLIATEAQIQEGLQILDHALTKADGYYTGK
mgnify:CR=1 FL=1